MGLAGALAREVRGHRARRRRRAVHGAGAERRRRARCGDGPHVLDLSLRARARRAPVLRPREPRPRDPRRHAVHGHDRRAPARDRREERQAGLEHDGRRRAADRYSITMAPIVVKDKVIVGTGGGDMGIRGYIAAFDAKTGKEVWRFYTIPGPASPATRRGPATRGRPAARRSGTRAPTIRETNLAFWGTGNPGARLGRTRTRSATTSTATASSRSTSTPAS